MPYIRKPVNEALAAVLPADGTPWYRKAHLVRLNLAILSLILLSATYGYDGSMMNSLQALPQWHKFMDKPQGAWLGFISSARYIGGWTYARH